MKRSLIFLLPALLAMASCGSTAQYATSQQVPDGIYYRPEPVVELYTEDDFKAMAAQNIASKSQSKKDTVVVIMDDFYSVYYGYPYAYSSFYGPSWRYRRHYGWGPSWSFGWYGGWYDPWDPWYDPYWGSPYWGGSYWGHYH